MDEMKGELKAFAAWWKTTPYKGKARSQSTIREYLRVLHQYAEANPNEGHTLDLLTCREWVASETERASGAGRWAARALKAFVGWQAFEYNEPRRLLKLAVPAEPEPQKIPVAKPEDITKMLQACEGDGFCDLRDGAMIHVLRSTGMRIGEQQLGPGAHLVCHGKRRKQRCTPLTANTVAQ